MTELNNLAIRRLTIEDIDSLCLIENLSFPTPWTRESYQHELAENPLSIFVGCFEGWERLGGI